MRERIISIFLIIIFVFSIYGCAKTGQDNLAAQEEVAETLSAKSQDIQTEPQNVESQDSESQYTETDFVEAEAERGLDTSVDDGQRKQMFTYIVNDSGAVVTGFQEEYESFIQKNKLTNLEIDIPDTLGGHPVIEIGDGAFENIKLTSVNIPESVEAIGNSAFRNTGIEKVNFSQCYYLKEVKDNAFENCNLQEDPDYSTWFMEKIGERAFAENAKLTRVNFRSGDVVIGKEAFDGCGEELLFFVDRNKEEAGKEVELYAAANGIQVEYSVSTQINLPSKPLTLVPEIGSFFYGVLGGTWDDLEDDMWCSMEKTPDAPNFGFEDGHWPGCSKWCHIITFANWATASSELSSASGRYSAGNIVCEDRGFAWAEGVEGAGIGEYIIYDQIVYSGNLIEPGENRILRSGFYGEDGYIDYTQICIVNGYARDAKVWEENGRVKTFMTYVNDMPYARLELEDTINPQYFTIPQGDIRVANGGEVSFKFVIEDVYPGTTYEDTCITGISIDFGNVPDWH